MREFQKISIVHLSLAHAPFWQFGGLPRIMEVYLQGLRNLGWKVVVLASNHDLDVLEPYKSDPERFYFQPTPWMRWMGRWNFNVNPFHIWRFIHKLSRNKEVIILHVSQSRSIFNLIAFFASFLPNVKIIFSPFGSLPDRNRALIKIFDYFVTRPFVRRVDLGFAQTAHEQKVIESFGCSEVKILPLSLDSPVTKPVPKLTKQSPCKFLFLGRFHSTKGIPKLLAIFSKLKKSGYQFHLDLVGDDQGDESRIRDEIDRLNLAPFISVMPPVYGNERFLLYSKYDAFVFRPDVFEETSLACLEALSAGTPVFTTLKSDIPHLSMMSAGYVSETDKEYLDNLSSFLDMNYLEHIGMRSRARKTYETYFDSSQSVLILEKYLEQLL